MKAMMANKNLWILFVGQLISVSGSALMVTLGGIVGQRLAIDKSLATLPQALHIIGIALFAVPAAMFMRRFGRRFGFSCAAVLGILSQLLAIYAIRQQSLELFSLAALILGANSSFAQQLRFAATEASSADHAARAISFVLLGAIIGGYLGPKLASHGDQWINSENLTGGFLLQAALFLGVIAVYQLLNLKKSVVPTTELEKRRPLKKLVAQPLFLLAVLAAAVSQLVMSLIMTATPLSMHVNDGFSVAETSRVIQAHVMSMYLPSLFSGYLIDRFGIARVMLPGAVILILCVAIALSGHAFMHYWFALVFLGVGWNFLFVSGTTLLTKTYLPQERFVAQAVNEFVVYGCAAIAATMAGVFMHFYGWNTLVLATVPFIVLTIFSLFVLRRSLTLR